MIFSKFLSFLLRLKIIIQMSQYPKLSWAQNRRTVNITFHISKNQNENPSQPSIVFSKQDKFRTLTINCQGCLPHENPNDTLRNFEISLELFAPVFPIESQHQITVTDKYVRLRLFKRAKRSWEKMLGNSLSEEIPVDKKSTTTASTIELSQEYYRKNQRTAIIYDWDLDSVLERQMKEALEEAEMLKDDYSDDSSDVDHQQQQKQKHGKESDEAGFDAGASEEQSSMNESFADRNASKKKVLRKTQKTSRASKDPVYGDIPSSDSPDSADDELSDSNNNNKLSDNKKEPSPSLPPSPTTKSEEQEKQPRQQEKQLAEEQQQKQQQKELVWKRQQQVFEKQIVEMNKILPAGQRRSLTDRQVLILVIVISTIVGLLAALVGGSVVYMNLSSVINTPNSIAKKESPIKSDL